MKTFLPLILLLSSIQLFAQANSAECDKFINIAKTAEAKGDFRNAIINYRAADVYCNSQRKAEIGRSILKIYDKIEAQRNKALAAERALNREKKAVEVQRDRARSAEDYAVLQAKRAERSAMSNYNVSLALNLLRTNPTLALRLAEKNYALYPTELAAEAAYFQILGDTSLRFYQQDIRIPSPAHRLAVYPNGEMAVAGLVNGNLALWRLIGEPSLQIIPAFNRLIDALAISPDGRYLLAGSQDQKIILWEVSNLQTPVYTKDSLQRSIIGVGFSPDSRHFAFMTEDGKMEWHAIDQPDEKISSFLFNGDVTGGIAIAPDGSKIVACGRDFTLKVWEINDPEKAPITLKAHTGIIRHLEFSPDGQYLFSCGDDGKILQWQLNTPQSPVYSYPGDKNSVRCIAFHSSGKMFISGGADKTVKLWELGNTTAIYVYHGHEEPIWNCAFIGSSSNFLSNCEQGSIKKWSLHARPGPLNTTKCHTGMVTALHYQTDQDRLWSAGTDGKVFRWKDESLLQADTIQAHDAAVLELAFSPAQLMITASAFDSLLRIWTTDSEIQLQQSNDFPSTAVQCFQLSPSGTYLALAFRDSTVWIGKTSNLKQGLFQLKGYRGLILSMVFSLNEKTIYTSSEDGMIRQWALKSPDAPLLASWNGQLSEVYELVLSEDGEFLYALSYDHTIRAWKLREPNAPPRIYDLSRLPGDVYPILALSPNGSEIATIIATAEQKPQLGIFSQKGASEPFWVYSGDTSTITTAVYSPSGEYIYVGLEDGSVVKRGTPSWFIRTQIAPFSLSDLLLKGLRIDTVELLKNNDPEFLKTTAAYFSQIGAVEAAKKKWELIVRNDPSPESYLGLYQAERALRIDRTNDYLALDSAVVVVFAQYFRKNGEWAKARAFYEKWLSLAKNSSLQGRVTASIYEVSLRGNLAFDRDSFFQFKTVRPYEVLIYQLTGELNNSWSASQTIFLYQDMLLIFEKLEALYIAGVGLSPGIQAFLNGYISYFEGALGANYADRDGYTKALTYLQASFEKNPSEPDFSRLIPLTLFMTGQETQAKEMYGQLLSDPETPFKKYFLEDLEYLLENGKLITAQRVKAESLIEWLKAQ